MPAKGKSAVTAAQRRKIAAGKAMGKTAKEIAPAVGLSEFTVDKQSRDPRTVTIMQRLKHRDEAILERIWGKALSGLEKDVAHGDQDVRRHARAQFYKVLVAGEPPLARMEAGGNTGGDFTLEELIVSYRRATVHVP